VITKSHKTLCFTQTIDTSEQERLHSNCVCAADVLYN